MDASQASPRKTSHRPSCAPVAALAFVVVAVALDLLALGGETGPLLRAAPALGALGSLAHHGLTLAAAVFGLTSLLACRRAGRAARDENLAEISRRLELAMEASRIGFWDVDLDHDRLLWDERACQLMGVPPREGVFGEADWLGAVHPEDRQPASAAAEAAIATGGRFISDYRVIWPGGEVRHLRDMAAFYRARDGSPRLTGLVWDVTADKRREAELEERRREAEAATLAKSNFLAAMSHEIRTPLAGVIGMLDLLMADPLPPCQAERARVASASAHHLLGLLSDVLDVSKLGEGAVTLHPAPTDARRLIGDVLALMGPRAAEKGLDLRCEVETDVPAWIEVDPVRLRQVLTNLVSNAIAFTEAGHLAVRAAHGPGPCGPALAVEVEDTGIGIAQADQARIFERFVQADGSASRPFGGSGLGLAIARQLVELMGGVIDVRSAPGQGSTFRFTLRAPPCPAPAEDEPPGAALERPARALRVLVADDNATNQCLIKALLHRAGHAVVPVGNGREAVEAARGGGFDAVLMDIHMPVMDGLAAARAIRALPGPAGRTPIVALTASVLADERARYLEAGMDDCLPKPIDVAALARTLARLAAPSARLGSPTSETDSCGAEATG